MGSRLLCDSNEWIGWSPYGIHSLPSDFVPIPLSNSDLKAILKRKCNHLPISRIKHGSLITWKHLHPVMSIAALYFRHLHQTLEMQTHYGIDYVWLLPARSPYYIDYIVHTHGVHLGAWGQKCSPFVAGISASLYSELSTPASFRGDR